MGLGQFWFGTLAIFKVVYSLGNVSLPEQLGGLFHKFPVNRTCAKVKHEPLY